MLRFNISVVCRSRNVTCQHLFWIVFARLQVVPTPTQRVVMQEEHLHFEFSYNIILHLF